MTQGNGQRNGHHPAPPPGAQGVQGVRGAAEAHREGARDVPLRALIARDVDGLLLAGRCISGDFVAHGNYRVTGNAAAMGQAAGTLAAVAARSGERPHLVPWAAVRDELQRLGLHGDVPALARRP